MCLAKRLQRDLTSLDLLWLPPARPALARFINSLVLAEETDLDPDGAAASHFELYVQGMEEVGASTTEALGFLAMLREGRDLDASLAAWAPPAARTFVSQTLTTVEQGTTIEVLSSLLFGREDLIPEMFSRLVPQWIESQASAAIYLLRRAPHRARRRRATDPPVCVRSPRQPRTTSAHGRRPVVPPHRRWPRASPCGTASTPSWRGSIHPTPDRDSAVPARRCAALQSRPSDTARRPLADLFVPLVVGAPGGRTSRSPL